MKWPEDFEVGAEVRGITSEKVGTIAAVEKYAFYVQWPDQNTPLRYPATDNARHFTRLARP